MPESKRRKKKGSRPRRRPPTRRPLTDELSPVDGIVRTILDGGKELVELEDPLEAEVWASGVLGTTYKPPLPITEHDRFGEAVWDGVLTRAEAEGAPTSLAVLRALGAVASDPVASRATEAADRLAAGGTTEPAWRDEIGTTELVDTWRLADPYGDQTMYYASFRYPGRPAHALTALYDENLGAIMKDAGVGTVVGDPRARAAEGPDSEVEDIDASALAGVVRAAIASGDMYLDNDWTQDFKELRALLLARMRGLPAAVPPETVPPDDAAREALVDEFLATPDAPPDDDVTRSILDHCLMARCDFGDGDPLRWSPTVVEMFLLDFLPRKAVMDTAQIRAMPDVLRRWVGFALERRGLERRWIDETQAAIERFTPAFRRAVTDQSNFGPAKAITNAMRADGIDLLDEEAVQGWIEAFNARPFEERDEFLRDRAP
jgi:hypothetical protein